MCTVKNKTFIHFKLSGIRKKKKGKGRGIKINGLWEKVEVLAGSWAKQGGGEQ